jgi:type II secretory pathway component GspD/PulD (secretin)
MTMPLFPHLARPGAVALAVAVLLTTVPLGAQNISPRSRAPVTVNFVNADLEAVTRAFAAMIDRPILVDPRVRGTITVYSEQPQSVREAWQNYQAALRGLGLAVHLSSGDASAPVSRFAASLGIDMRTLSADMSAMLSALSSGQCSGSSNATASLSKSTADATQPRSPGVAPAVMPRSRAMSIFDSVRAVPNTVAPNCRAICTAVSPTPLPTA